MRCRRTALGAATVALVAGCTTDASLELRQAEPGARPGGVLRVATTTPGSVDPGNVYEPAGELLVRTMCTPLLTTDPETSEVLPGVVESYLITDDGQSIALRLREDAVFSDGTKVRAQDVAFTLSRVASADYASTSAERLAPVDGYAEVHGDEPTDEDVERQRLRGVRVRDDENVQIQLLEPLADFVRVLTSPLLSPVSRSAAERDPDGFGRNPVCVGPYRLEKPYAPGDDALRLVRSKAYAPVDASLTAGGRGYADSIEVRFHPDVAAAAAAVAKGDADVAPARPSDVLGVQLGPGTSIEYLGLPAGSPGLADPRVRRALALAVDREELVRRVFPRTRVAAQGFLPPTSDTEPRCGALPPGGDPAEAARLLAQAGADLSGVRVPFYFNDELRNRELVTEVARQLRETVGLTAVPTPLTYPQFLAKGTGTQGFDGLFRFSWSVPYADVDGYLHPLFSSDRIGRDNLSRFSDPAVDRALDRVAREAEDEQDRTLGYAQVTELLCEQMPMVPLTASLSRWLVDDGVGAAGGRHVDGGTGQLMVRDLYLKE